MSFVRTQGLHTSISSAILFLTQAWTSPHFVTLITGVLLLVNRTTSSINVRKLTPIGPPCLDENSILSLWLASLILFVVPVKPFMVLRPIFLLSASPYEQTCYKIIHRNLFKNVQM